jgi:hypothetical protein
VTIRFPLERASVEICSPFGGILYVVREGGQPVECDVSFRGVGKHPIYAVGDETSLADAPSLSVPWGEIITAFVIFTVPASLFAAGFDLQGGARRLDLLIVAVLTFLADDSAVPYRVVFDAELGVCAKEAQYPLVFPVESAETFFAAQATSEPLFQFLKRLAMLSIQAESLGVTVKEALASLAVSAAAERVWPQEAEAVRQMIGTGSPLFALFRTIFEKSDPQLFPKVISTMRLHGTGSLTPDKAFARLVSRASGTDVVHTIMTGATTPREARAAEGLLEYRLAVPDSAPIRG